MKVHLIHNPPLKSHWRLQPIKRALEPQIPKALVQTFIQSPNMAEKCKRHIARCADGQAACRETEPRNTKCSISRQNKDSRLHVASLFLCDVPRDGGAQCWEPLVGLRGVSLSQGFTLFRWMPQRDFWHQMASLEFFSKLCTYVFWDHLCHKINQHVPVAACIENELCARAKFTIPLLNNIVRHEDSGLKPWKLICVFTSRHKLYVCIYPLCMKCHGVMLTCQHVGDSPVQRN